MIKRIMSAFVSFDDGLAWADTLLVVCGGAAIGLLAAAVLA